MTTINAAKPGSSAREKSMTPPKGTIAIPELYFEQKEIEQFREDDAEAGRIIGKLLSSLFIYSAVVMSFIIWWTLRVVSQ